jgi:sucrose-6-phosphate hydrolase SacC (GH32 family)
MLLCISHPLGCRYYLGDWDAAAEQFVPQTHGRMNWRRDDQRLDDVWRDFFAPESVRTADGRRIMWAWLATVHPRLGGKTLQSLPRELRLGDDGTLRIRPARELEALRGEPITLRDVAVALPPRHNGGSATTRITDLPGDAAEVRIVIDRKQAARKRFGFRLFAGEGREGLPIVVKPETGTIRVGATDAPFAVADLADDEDVVLRLFVDKYLVEVFASDRQAVVAAHMDWRSARGLHAYTFGAPTTIKQVDVWPLRPANQGFREAQKNRVWQPKTR